MIGHSMLWTTIYFVVELADVSHAMILDAREYQVVEALPGSELCALGEPTTMRTEHATSSIDPDAMDLIRHYRLLGN